MYIMYNAYIYICILCTNNMYNMYSVLMNKYVYIYIYMQTGTYPWAGENLEETRTSQNWMNGTNIGDPPTDKTP